MMLRTGAQWVSSPATDSRLLVPEPSLSLQSAATSSSQPIQVVPNPSDSGAVA
ncbi:hypothetical protein SRB5_44630 [Streptomyces sp. RB5]|uniref:Uncharacterized protein n=1 Tax=Streptomyces smaragdinus TaxID=2585196 RepID=A0A7K0CLC7_9ACTN|nr:hypothetical protein [Streptomyces smaragdinus]